MIMTPRLRTFALTAHVTSTVGWVGAVAVFLALAVLGLSSQDEQTVRGAYLVMEPAAWVVLVPLAFASLLTGMIMSLCTTWGLFRHYWVVFKLVITVFATVILLIYTATFGSMASVAADPTVDLSLVRNPSPTLHAVLALVLLLVATVLAVYKPRGMTAYGWRKQYNARWGTSDRPFYAGVTGGDDTVPPARGSTTSTRWQRYLLLGIIGLALLFVVLHFTGGGIGGLHKP